MRGVPDRLSPWRYTVAVSEGGERGEVPVGVRWLEGFCHEQIERLVWYDLDGWKR